MARGVVETVALLSLLIAYTFAKSTSRGSSVEKIEIQISKEADEPRPLFDFMDERDAMNIEKYLDEDDEADKYTGLLIETPDPDFVMTKELLVEASPRNSNDNLESAIEVAAEKIDNFLETENVEQLLRTESFRVPNFFDDIRPMGKELEMELKKERRREPRPLFPLQLSTADLIAEIESDIESEVRKEEKSEREIRNAVLDNASPRRMDNLNQMSQMMMIEEKNENMENDKMMESAPMMTKIDSTPMMTMMEVESYQPEITPPMPMMMMMEKNERNKMNQMKTGEMKAKMNADLTSSSTVNVGYLPQNGRDTNLNIEPQNLQTTMAPKPEEEMNKNGMNMKNFNKMPLPFIILGHFPSPGPEMKTEKFWDDFMKKVGSDKSMSSFVFFPQFATKGGSVQKVN